jgi:uncharacterized membrane protein
MESDPQNIPSGKSIFHDFIHQPVSADLKIAGLVIILSLVGIYSPFSISVIRIVFAFPLALFIPGYMLMLVFFPRKNDIGHIERFSLSIGLSIAILPLICLILNFSPWGIHLDPLVVSIITFILIMAIIARFRQITLPFKEQYLFPFDAITGLFEEKTDGGDSSRGNRNLSIILIIGILVAIGVTAFMITIPKQDEKFTEFYLLGPTGMATGYPEQIVPGRAYSLQIGIGNHEYRTINYTVEVYLVPTNETASMTLSGLTPLKSYSVDLNHNQTSVLPLEFSAPAAEFYRMEFLLFNETIPGQEVSGQDRINASYRNLHLQINATVPVSIPNSTLIQVR